MGNHGGKKYPHASSTRLASTLSESAWISCESPACFRQIAILNPRSCQPKNPSTLNGLKSWLRSQKAFLRQIPACWRLQGMTSPAENFFHFRARWPPAASSTIHLPTIVPVLCFRNLIIGKMAAYFTERAVTRNPLKRDGLLTLRWVCLAGAGMEPLARQALWHAVGARVAPCWLEEVPV